MTRHMESVLEIDMAGSFKQISLCGEYNVRFHGGDDALSKSDLVQRALLPKCNRLTWCTPSQRLAEQPLATVV